MDSTTYQDPTTKNSYIHIRTQTDWHHTKWSNYKKPEGYHPYNGMDWRSEYLYTKRDDNFSSQAPPHVVIATDFVNNYRAYFYLLLFGMSQAYQVYKYQKE